MKQIWKLMIPLIAIGTIFLSCERDNFVLEDEIPQEVINKISNMGFNPDGIEQVPEGYRIERDIIITHENLEEVPEEHRVPQAEQYHTFNLVSTGGSREIKLFIPTGSGGGKGKKGGEGFSQTYVNALNEAIARFNAESLEITMRRVTGGKADISFTRLSSFDEQSGVLGSAGFPSRKGNPYREIKMSGILESLYGLNVDGIATIMAHEIGHCIGFRHTDWFNRSISCNTGGSEGAGRIGAEHIPGTPTGATNTAKSWMLSCTDGGNRPFNNDDQTALDYLY
ncbi:MAG: zinc-dependent metalloprotease [Saprospiraceae bacterium]|nr:zinc-dependent metalloprotease [Saprospiraceae bacterium]